MGSAEKDGSRSLGASGLLRRSCLVNCWTTAALHVGGAIDHLLIMSDGCRPEDLSELVWAAPERIPVGGLAGMSPHEHV